MVRLLSIFLIVTYFSGSLGLKVNQHFCCGELIKLELLLGQTPKNCSGQPIESKSKCCQDQTQNLQVDPGSHVNELILAFESFQFQAIFPTRFFDYFYLKPTVELIQPKPAEPPPEFAQGLRYLVFRKLII